MTRRWGPGPTLLLLAVTVAGRSAADAPSNPMAAAAKAFLATLGPEAAAQARLPFDSEERFHLQFEAGTRAGLPLKKMSAGQQSAALALLETGLSEKGYRKVRMIRALERRLARVEDAAVRDPDLYYVAIFGDPGGAGPWGWRFEGDNISLHWTVVGGRIVSASPQFLGARPAEVRDGPLKGARALGAEEDLARKLVKSLTAPQRQEALLGAEPPKEILSGTSRGAAGGGGKGVAWGSLSPEQQATLLALVGEHVSTQPSELANARIVRMGEAGLDGLRFAWMGGTEKGNRCYYRVEGPTFLIEYVNSEDEGNHAHEVWRELGGDWGEAVLAASPRQP